MLLERMMRAARLDTSLYEEVEANTSLTSQAATVVVIVAVCQGIGGAIAAATAPPQAGAGNPIVVLIVGLLGALFGWVVWSYITYFIGTSIFKGAATPGEMLRTIGFAQTPGVLGILGFIPFLGGIAGLVAGIWTLIAGVIAIRQALDFSTGKAVLTALVGWLALVIITVMLAVVFGVGNALTRGVA